jgi:hypothetical protein
VCGLTSLSAFLYRPGLVQKARAWEEAAERGLRASVDDAGEDADHAA